MNFIFRDLIEESTLTDLYKNAVNAFPNTTKRQYATNPIKITNLRWTPFVGLRTLFVRGLAQNENREYNPIIFFKNVKYLDKSGVSLMASDGKEYFLEQLSAKSNDVLVRCNCQDFYWRFNYHDYLDKSLHGNKRKKYEAKHNPGSANPLEMPGMCKHLMKMMKTLGESGILAEIVEKIIK